ncbi:MAG: hypothetical protein ACLSHC_14500 [Bilophila wadsworthia]
MRTRRATAKNALEVAKRDAAVAACPYKEGDIVSGSRRHQSGKGRQNPVHPSYPYYDLRVLPITEGGKPSRRHRYAYNVLDVTPYEGDE